MWILPNKKVVNFPRPIRVGDTNHPAGIFYKWSPEELATIGIKEYREQKVDDRFYRKGSPVLHEGSTLVEKTYTAEPKYTINELKKKMNVKLKAQLKSLYLEAKKEADFLDEFSLADDMVEALVLYRALLRQAYGEIRSAVILIDDYQELIDYNWNELLPVSPVEGV